MTNYPILDAQLADDPMAAWSLQETSGPTMADVSGYGRNGTYTNATYNQEPIFAPAARSVSFGAGSSSTANGNVSYASWMNCDEWTVEAAGYCINGAPQNLIINRDGITAGRVFQFKIYQNKLEAIGFRVDGGYTQVVSTNTFTDNVPHLFAARYTTTKLSVWIDGVKVGEVGHPLPQPAAQTTGNRGIQVGNYDTGYAYNFLGRLSHVAFYNKALSDARMAAHFTSTNDLNLVPAFTQEQIVLSLTPSYNQDVNLTTAFTVEDFTVQTNVTSMDALVTCDFTIEDLTPAADPYPAGDVELSAPFEIEELTIFGAVGGVEIVEASEEYIVEDVIFAVTPQYVDFYEVTAEFTLENPALTVNIDHNTPITPDPFTPTVVGVEMFCLLETLPAYAAPPGGLWTYDGTEMLLPAAPGWTPEV